MKFLTPLALAFLLAFVSISTTGCGEAETKPSTTAGDTDTETASDEKAGSEKKDAGSEKKDG